VLVVWVYTSLVQVLISEFTISKNFMALLKCRNCGAEISSDARVTRCKGCGTLFPFDCNVCGRSLRPPFPVYSDERYLTGTDEPLCPDHFQRQCPSCKTWFQADENPGYFMCKMCLEVREAAVAPSPSPVAVGATVLATATGTAGSAATSTTSGKTPAHFPQWDDDMVAERDPARDLVSSFLFAIVCLSMIAVLGVLIWQVISLLRLLFGV
jgi:hypothetical protein